MLMELLADDAGGWSFSEAAEPAHFEAKLLYQEMSQLFKPSSKAIASPESTSSPKITSIKAKASSSTRFFWPTTQTEKIEKSVDLSPEAKITGETKVEARNDDDDNDMSVVGSIVNEIEPAREEAECIYKKTRSFVSSNIGTLRTIEEKQSDENSSVRSIIADAIEPAKEEAIMLVNETKAYIANTLGSMRAIQENDSDDDNKSVLSSIGSAINPAREKIEHLYSRARSLISTNVGPVGTFEDDSDSVSILGSITDIIKPAREEPEFIHDETKSFFVSSKGKVGIMEEEDDTSVKSSLSDPTQDLEFVKMEEEDDDVPVDSSLFDPIQDQDSFHYDWETSFVNSNVIGSSYEEDESSSKFASFLEALELTREEVAQLYQETTSSVDKLLLQAKIDTIAERQNGSSKEILAMSSKFNITNNPSVGGNGSAICQEDNEASIPASEILDDNLSASGAAGKQEVAQLLKELLKASSAQSTPSIEEVPTTTDCRRGSFQRRLDSVFDQASLDLSALYATTEKPGKLCTV
jgi:hypothetical protein